MIFGKVKHLGTLACYESSDSLDGPLTILTNQMWMQCFSVPPDSSGSGTGIMDASGGQVAKIGKVVEDVVGVGGGPVGRPVTVIHRNENTLTVATVKIKTSLVSGHPVGNVTVVVVGPAAVTEVI